MVSARLSLVIAAVLFAPCAHGATQGMTLNVNPIRRVVTMLQMMQKKVEQEGKKEQELFDAFMCYCKNGVGSLVDSIKDAEAKIAQLESSIEETDASTKQLVADVKKAKADRKEAEETIAKAEALRSTEAKAFAKMSADSKTNIGAMGKAVASLEKGMGGAFLQTKAATELKRLSITMDISEADRDVLASFLSNGGTDSESYDPASGEITGILKQMKETMEKELAEAEKTESAGISDFDALVAAKQKQVSTLTKEIESKMQRSGESGVQLTNQHEDLSDTQKSYAEDKKFLIDVTQDCQTKEAEKQTNDKLRADELLALADTIKILNDDDALDLFKKTLPTPSLLQLRVTSMATRQQALQMLAQGKKHHKDFRLNLISLALRGKKVSFDKVLGMIDEMSTLLKKEQVSDDTKKAYCAKNIDETEDDVKVLQGDTDDLKKQIAEHKASIETVMEEIAALTAGIKSMDKQVADATEQRKKENAEYKELMSSDGAAKELLGMAKNRLAKFYTPKLHKPAPKRQLSEEERITVNMGGTLAPTAAPGGIAGTGVTSAFAQYQAEAKEESLGFLQVRAAKRAAPPPPPATAGAYKKAGEESGGVMAMLDLLIADMDKEMTEADVAEKEAQKEYEQMIEDSAAKRAGDSKSISDKEANKVELQANTIKMQQERKDKMKESLAKVESLQALHSECDWLLSNYDTRKEARASEVENLTNAKAVLSGADYSFLQTATVHLHEH
jgi:septal ring factor EnvC (AmiA/AmiB activator)